ncbi:MAG: hypothetical protein V1725_08035 [archaeon]
MTKRINLNEFIKYFNRKSLQEATQDAARITITRKDFTAILLMLSQQDYKQEYTIQFLLKFEHRKTKEEGIFQREFSIEHHPTPSKHSKPHVQVHIHGPDPTDKVGELWITLPLKKDAAYKTCIEGFFSILENIIRQCEPGLEEVMLDITEVQKLTQQKTFLHESIQESLRTKDILYQQPDGTKILLTPKNITGLLNKDQALLPFFQ